MKHAKQRVQVWLSSAELELIASQASEPLRGRAIAAARKLKDRESDIEASFLNSTWSDPFESEYQSERPLLPIWKLTRGELEDLVRYLDGDDDGNTHAILHVERGSRGSNGAPGI